MVRFSKRIEKSIPKKYPRFTREQDLRCKLMNSDIQKLRRDYATGLFLQKELARKYGITPPTVRYWTNSDYHYFCCHKGQKVVNKKEWRDRHNLRKRTLQPEVRRYRIELRRKQRQREKVFEHNVDTEQV